MDALAAEAQAAGGGAHPKASMQYIRHEDFFVLLASEGEHRFFEEEAGIKDARVVPIVYAGYSVGLRGGRVHVRIADETYKDLQFLFIFRHTTDPQSRPSPEEMQALGASGTSGCRSSARRFCPPATA
jgi:hypothetical protein